MRQTALRAGRVLCAASGVACLVVHAATFLTTVTMAWFLPILFLQAASIICVASVSQVPKASFRWPMAVLFAYAVATFAYAIVKFDGATGLYIMDGQFVATDGNRIVRVISEQEYRMLNSLWMRAMSAWCGALAGVLLSNVDGHLSSA